MALISVFSFQSPSLRGSGRFALTEAEAIIEQLVSIPFIAGQWSLLACRPSAACSSPTFQSPSLRGSGRFVANDPALNGVRLAFQSPSLRGSGRFVLRLPSVRAPGRGFQSPSLRGSGRFARRTSAALNRPASFNPLHCGAVVASLEADPDFHGIRLVSIPFIAGQWSLRMRLEEITELNNVSIPFIAGQWSLQVIIAWLRLQEFVVSIPFIAGQWSLLREELTAASDEEVFQSPSLRGSGRFLRALRISHRRRQVSIPFIAGQWSLPRASPATREPNRNVSIPFIAGQWSLRLTYSW